MTNNPVPPGKPYVYAFSTRKLVLLACMVLALIALSLMLGIRIERYQRSADLASVGGVGEGAPVEPTGSSPKAGPADSKPGVAPQKAATKPQAEPAATSDVKDKPVESDSQPKPKPLVSTKAAQAAKSEAKPAVAAKPTRPSAPSVEKTVPRGHYAVQVESSQDRAKAGLQVELLKKKGFASYLEEIQLENRGLYFRVMVGPFRTRAEAVKAQSALAKDSRFAGSYIRYLP